MPDSVSEGIEKTRRSLADAIAAAKAEGCPICAQLLEPIDEQLRMAEQIRMTVDEYLSATEGHSKYLSDILADAPAPKKQYGGNDERPRGLGLMDFWKNRPRATDIFGSYR
jgi:hypothetical protein